MSYDIIAPLILLMNKKWVGGNLSWCLLFGRNHSDTLPVGPGPAKAGDPDES